MCTCVSKKVICYHYDLFSCRWSLHYGYGILGACSALSGMYVNNYFRSRLRLHTYGRVSSYLPVVALPALMSALFHQQVKQFVKLHGMFCMTNSQIYWIVVSALFKKFPSYNVSQRFITHKINCYCTASCGMGNSSVSSPVTTFLESKKMSTLPQGSLELLHNGSSVHIQEMFLKL